MQYRIKIWRLKGRFEIDRNFWDNLCTYNMSTCIVYLQSELVYLYHVVDHGHDITSSQPDQMFILIHLWPFLVPHPKLHGTQTDWYCVTAEIIRKPVHHNPLLILASFSELKESGVFNIRSLEFPKFDKWKFTKYV